MEWPGSVAATTRLEALLTPSPTTIVRAALFGAVILLASVAQVAAHADLESSDPADGVTLEAAPSEVSGVFSEPLDPAASWLLLLDADGGRVAEGGVDPEGGTATTMSLAPPALTPGTYEVRWTARTLDDGFVTRGRWTFIVSQSGPQAPPPSPSQTPAASSPVGSPSASGASSAPPASVAPTTDSSPSSSATPSARPVTPGDGGADPLGDVAVPLIALGAVAAAAVLYLARRPR